MEVIAQDRQTTAATGIEPRAGKYLTFLLDREEFGIPVLSVREIMGMQDITTVPQTPAHVKGVINLRGRVTPVVCLRSKFGLPETEWTPRTCIIVVQVPGVSSILSMGIIVDGVSEVLNITESEIEDTPDFGRGVSIDYVQGLAKVKSTVKILLDINRVLASQDALDLELTAKH